MIVLILPFCMLIAVGSLDRTTAVKQGIISKSLPSAAMFVFMTGL